MEDGEMPLRSFQDGDLQQAWIQAFAPNRPVIDLSPDGTPPVLMIQRGNGALPLPRQRLSSPTNPQLPSYQLPGCPGADDLEALLSEAWRRHRFGILELDLVPECSETHAAFKELRKDGWPIEMRTWQIAPVVQLGGGVEAWERTVSGHMRRDLNGKLDRLKRLAPVLFLEVARSPEWERWLARAFELEERGWKGRQGTAVNLGAGTRDFYLWAVRRFRAAGQLRLYLLLLGDRLVAFNLVVTVGRTAVDWKITFDEEFARFSPGNLLQRHVIRELLLEGGWERLDLMYPTSEFKRRWATASEARLRIRVFPNVGSGRLLFRLRRLLREVR